MGRAACVREETLVVITRMHVVATAVGFESAAVTGARRKLRQAARRASFISRVSANVLEANPRYSVNCGKLEGVSKLYQAGVVGHLGAGPSTRRRCCSGAAASSLIHHDRFVVDVAATLVRWHALVRQGGLIWRNIDDAAHFLRGSASMARVGMARASRRSLDWRFAPNQGWPNGQVQALNLGRVKVAVD